MGLERGFSLFASERAAAPSFLSGPEASFVTGTTLDVDVEEFALKTPGQTAWVPFALKATGLGVI